MTTPVALVEALERARLLEQGAGAAGKVRAVSDTLAAGPSLAERVYAGAAKAGNAVHDFGVGAQDSWAASRGHAPLLDSAGNRVGYARVGERKPLTWTGRMQSDMGGRPVGVGPAEQSRQPLLVQVEKSKLLENSVAERAARVGLRRSKDYVLTAADKDFIIEEFKAIGGNPNDIVFDTRGRTAYRENSDKINIRGDVFPGSEDDLHPNARLSVRAVLAHEMAHKRFRGTPLKPGHWLDEYRASMWAARNTPGLTAEDRSLLAEDALERARAANKPVKESGTIKSLRYGFYDGPE